MATAQFMMPPQVNKIGKKPGKIKMMIIGYPGFGKTRIMASAPRGLIIRPPTDHTESAAEVVSTCDEWVAETWAEMDEIHKTMRGISPAQSPWDWVMADCVSLLQEPLLDDVFADAVAVKPSRAAYGPDKGEYGINMYRLAKWTRDMMALPYHFGMTAHPFEDYDDDGEERIMPAIQGKGMPAKFCGYFNVVAHLQVVERQGKPPVRILVTDKSGKLYAKDQFDAFGGRIVNPTIPKIEKLVRAKLPAGLITDRPASRGAASVARPAAKKTVAKKTVAKKTVAKKTVAKKAAKK